MLDCGSPTAPTVAHDARRCGCTGAMRVSLRLLAPDAHARARHAACSAWKLAGGGSSCARTRPRRASRCRESYDARPRAGEAARRGRRDRRGDRWCTFRAAVFVVRLRTRRAPRRARCAASFDARRERRVAAARRRAGRAGVGHVRCSDAVRSGGAGPGPGPQADRCACTRAAATGRALRTSTGPLDRRDVRRGELLPVLGASTRSEITGARRLALHHTTAIEPGSCRRPSSTLVVDLVDRRPRSPRGRQRALRPLRRRSGVGVRTGSSTASAALRSTFDSART